MASTTAGGIPLLPKGWLRAYSKKSKRCYYVHEDTNISQWQFPTAQGFADHPAMGIESRRIPAQPTKEATTKTAASITPSPFTDRYEVPGRSPPRASPPLSKKRPPPPPLPASSRHPKRQRPRTNIIYNPPVIRDVMSSFEGPMTLIGQGTYGSVLLTRDRVTKQKVAIKCIEENTPEHDIVGFPFTALREMKILKALHNHHDNILNLKEIVTSKRRNALPGPERIFMVFDYHEYDLTGILQSSPSEIQLTQDHIKSWSQQLLLGCHYLHTNKVIHRDLKASNLLINHKGVLRIADFGLARSWHEGMRNLTATVITLPYRPPELLLGCSNYDTKVDMWSAGCILAEMFRRTPFFRGTDDKSQRHAIFSICGQPTLDEWPDVYQRCPKWKSVEASVRLKEFAVNQLPRLLRLSNKQPKHWMTDKAIDLISNLLILNPSTRLSAEQALTAEYFFESPIVKPSKELNMRFKLSNCHESDIKRKVIEKQNKHNRSVFSKWCGNTKK